MISSPWFIDAEGNQPEPNPDAIVKQALHSLLPLNPQTDAWKDDEDEALSNSVVLSARARAKNKSDREFLKLQKPASENSLDEQAIRQYAAENPSK